MTTASKKTTAREIAAPPRPPLPPVLIYAIVLLAGFSLGRALPLAGLPAGWNQIPAFLLSLGGAVIALSGIFALRRARTTVNPYGIADGLVATGPYLRTRNPIYLGLAWIYLGLASWSGSLWPLLLFPVLITVMNRFVIAGEEAHLEARFGKAWKDYKARVRRWM